MRRAKFSPSQLAHLEKCPGFASGPGSAAAQRGTDLDACITALISGEFVDIPVEFQDQVEFALDAFEQALARFNVADVTPQRFVRTAIPEVYGTADLVLTGRAKMNLEGDYLRRGGKPWNHGLIIDWKSGMADRGEAVDSIQLRCYAAGILAEDDSIDSVEMWFVELDKRYISKSRTIERKEFLDETHARIIKIIESVKNSTEADWKQNIACRYCVRAVTCPVLEASLKAIEVKDPVEIDDPRKAAEMMAPDRVSFFLTKWKAKVETASALVRQVEARAIAILKAGGDVPGWALGVGRNTRAWTDEAAAQKALMEACGPGVLVTELRPPAQIEKLFKEAKPLVKTLIINKPSEKLIQLEGENNAV